MRADFQTASRMKTNSVRGAPRDPTDTEMNACAKLRRMTSPVAYEVRDQVAVIRMDDGKANALSPVMLEALSAALTRASEEAKVVVLLGRPGRFSAGFDLKVMMSSPEAASALVRIGADLYLRLLLHPQPVVMGVTGHALAGGVLLAACGDVRIGVEGDFKLGLTEIGLGMPVPIFAHELARSWISPTRLLEATLLGNTYAPEAAREIGWLDRVVEAADHEVAVIAEANRLAAIAGGHYALTKKTLRIEMVNLMRRTLEENLAEFAAGVKKAG